MAALHIRMKPHLPRRASKLQDRSTEVFQHHRPCFAFVMARVCRSPRPEGFMNRRSSVFSDAFLYGRPGGLRKPGMRACVCFLAERGENRCLCSARHLFSVGMCRRCSLPVRLPRHNVRSNQVFPVRKASVSCTSRKDLFRIRFEFVEKAVPCATPEIE